MIMGFNVQKSWRTYGSFNLSLIINNYRLIPLAAIFYGDKGFYVKETWAKKKGVNKTPVSPL